MTPNITTHHDFILSNWLSGATVLSILLNNHRQITCNGETLPFPDQNPDELLCSCGKTVRECEFYSYAAGHLMSDESFSEKYFKRIPVVFGSTFLQRIFTSYFRAPALRDFICNAMPGFKERIKTFIEAHDKFYNLACEFDKSSVYLDGVKSPRRVELFAQYDNKPIRVLHSVRDGRKFVASYITGNNLSEEDIPKCAQDWVDYNDMVQLLQQRYPNIQIKEIRHEDLCQNKEGVIKEICEFFEVEYNPDIFIFDDSSYHILGNNMRNKFDGNVRENDKWKAVYARYNKDIFQKVTSIQKEYLVKYNYI